MKKKLKIAGIIAAVVIVLFILSRIFSGGKAGATADTSILVKGDIQNALSVSGPLEGTDSVDITSGLHAKISTINVKEGDKVTADETVLAVIDDTELRRSVDIARGNYELAAAQRDEKNKNAQLSYERAVQTLNTASKNLQRLNELAQIGAVSAKDVEDASAEVANARREVESYRVVNGRVVEDTSAELAVNNAKLELEKLESDLKSSTLYSPISGTVTRVHTKVGKFADGGGLNSGSPLITVEKLDKLQLNLLVSEYSIGKVAIGQTVEISADILGKGNAVSGRVESISPSGEERNGGSTERVIPVRISVDSEGSRLISGISARARIILEEKKDVWLVPYSAVGTNDEGKSVMQFVLGDGKGSGTVQTMQVETGIEGNIEVEILNNPLDALDMEYEPRYITTYQPGLTDGMQINYQP